MPLQRGGWLNFLVVCVCLAFSAGYEFFEWWTAVLTGDAANDFLGTQGDPWDTQWDMFMAFLRACCSVTLLSGWHDVSLRKVCPPAPPDSGA